MVGIIAIIFLLLPESPWWLVSKGRHDKATKVLLLCNGHVPGYNVQEQIVRSLLSTATTVADRQCIEHYGCYM
jgi:hypothetical protein